MESTKLPSERYGVEIKLDAERGTRTKRATVHVECLELSHVLAVLDAHDGDVRIFDRQKRDLVFDGHVGELRALLWASVMNQGETIQESMACRPLVVF